MHHHLHLILAAFGLLLLAACSDSGSDIITPDPVPSSIPVTFSALTHWDAPQTRLAEDANSSTVSFTPGDAIGVFAYLNDHASPDFMNNQKVVYNGNGWEYEPVKYWPKSIGDRISFYASSPYEAMVDGEIKVNGTSDGYPSVAYDNKRADIDWIVAKRESETYVTGKDGVNFDFKHLTAKVRFKFTIIGEAENEDYRPVVHLLQYDVPHIVGITQFKDGADNSIECTYNDQGKLMTLKRFVSQPEGISISRNGTVIDEFTVYLFPCGFPCDGNAATKGSFTISLNNIACTVTPQGQIELKAGKSYMVNFNIEKTDNTSNFFITSYSIWEDGGEYNGDLN